MNSKDKNGIKPVGLFLIYLLIFMPALSVRAGTELPNGIGEKRTKHARALYADAKEREAQIKQLGIESGPNHKSRPPMMTYVQAQNFAIAAVGIDPKTHHLIEDYCWRPLLGFYWIAIYTGEPDYSEWLLIVNRYTGEVWLHGQCEPIDDSPKLSALQLKLRGNLNPEQRLTFDKLRNLKPYFEGRGCSWSSEHLKNPFDWPK